MKKSNSKIKQGVKIVRDKLNQHPRHKRALQLISVIIFAVVGAAIVGFGLANETPPTPVASTTGKCGARVANYNYQVPFGKAAWNVPVCDLPKHPRSDDYASRFYNYGRGHLETDRNKINIGFAMGDLGESFSRAVYFADEAEGQTAKVQANGGGDGSNFDGEFKRSDPRRTYPETPIPWHKDWPISTAGDNEALVIDRDTGKLWAMSQAKRIYSDLAKNIASGALGECGLGLDTKRDFCVNSAKILRDHDGNIADYRTWEGSAPNRGAGISYFATLLTPEEVEAGEIRHALGIGLANTSFGPACTPEQLIANDPSVIDKICGTAVAPAGKFEWGGTPNRNPNLTLAQTVPEGMRFALKQEKFTDDYIRQIIKDKGITGEKANTVFKIVVAMRDYGVIAVDTGGIANIQVAGGISPQRRALWNKLGITEDKDKTLLHGLFDENSFYVVDTPVNNCIDGPPSKFYCKYTTSTYPNATVPPSNPLSPVPSTPPQPEPNTPPTVTLGDLNSKYVAPATVTLTANANDSDGIAKVEFFNGGIKIAEDTVAPFNTTMRNVSVGIYSITAKATDTKGASTTSSAKSFTVEPTSATIKPTAVTLPPEIPIRIEWNSKLFEFHHAAKLSWSASSSVNGIKSYTVIKNGQKIYEGTSLKHADFAIDVNQRYKYEVFVTDNLGNKSTHATYERTIKCHFWGFVCKFEK